jgi:glutaminase
VSLGLDEADVQRQVLTVYQEYFQNPFIIATEKYYRAESAAYVQNNSVADYMKKAEARLAEENKRVDMYLHDSTRKEVCLQLMCPRILAHRVVERSLRKGPHSGAQGYYGGRIPKSAGLGPYRWLVSTHDVDYS